MIIHENSNQIEYISETTNVDNKIWYQQSISESSKSSERKVIIKTSLFIRMLQEQERYDKWYFAGIERTKPISNIHNWFLQSKQEREKL